MDQGDQLHFRITKLDCASNKENLKQEASVVQCCSAGTWERINGFWNQFSELTLTLERKNIRVHPTE